MNFYTEEQQREYEDAMAQDCMSQGEYMSAALRQYAGAYGEVDPDRAWILTPFDTWERNPHYVGPPVRHPEDDYDDGDVEGVEVVPVYATPGSILDADWDDEIPF